MEKLKVGVIGIGGRGSGMLQLIASMTDTIEVVAVCDKWEDRVEKARGIVRDTAGNDPVGVTDYHDLLNISEIRAVVITASWTDHIQIAIDCMKAGKYSACEVGGAYTLDDCWRLVHTFEETHVPAMLLENCNYGRDELLVLNMVKKGIFGEVVHCAGGYRHDLRYGLGHNREPERPMRHYRQAEYQYRNCDNYPTHDLGPIAKICNINRGNRMLKLVSTSSKARGMNDYLLRKDGPEYPLSGFDWAQGDVITTTIQCARGETITLTLDTTLPRPYSRSFQVCGTRAFYNEDNRSIFVDGEYTDEDHTSDGWQKHWGNVTKYYERYEHPLWKNYDPSCADGHGGMDGLALRAFFDAARRGVPTPIDAYDMAAWMSITTLSEDSIALGGHPVAIPDFTRGIWFRSRDVYEGEFEL